MNSPHTIHSIAFYNTENLFDVYLDKKTIDQDFQPTASKRWTESRYLQKINNISYVLTKIGVDRAGKPPVLIGLAEVENDTVIKHLLESDHLKKYNYDFIHFNSMDERGIDVALLYNKDAFKFETAQNIPLHLEDRRGNIDHTRDILMVSGYLDGHKIHVFLNHWPSRHEGRDHTEFKRIIAAKTLGDVISTIKKDDEDAQIIVMGDFNDNPNSPSILKLKNENSLYNTMESLWSYSRGSVNHKSAWILFDQILVTSNFLKEGRGPFQFVVSQIFDDAFLKQTTGKYKGQPHRTYVGKTYTGGYSDHFPVYIQIQKRPAKNTSI